MGKVLVHRLLLLENGNRFMISMEEPEQSNSGPELVRKVIEALSSWFHEIKTSKVSPITLVV